jgi:multidrug resistance efflux pump
MKRAAIIITVLAAIAFVVFIFLGNQNIVSGSEQSDTPAANIPREEVPTALPDLSAVKSSDEVVAEGKLVPINYVNLSFNTSGLLNEVYVSDGEYVEAGQLLAKLSDLAEYESNLAAAQLELVNAQQEIKVLYDNAPLAAAEALQDIASAPDAVSDAERQLNNLQTGVVNDIDVEIARANVAFAKKNLEDAQAAYQPYANRPEGNLTRAALLSKLAEAEKDYEDAIRKLNALTGGPTDQKVAEAEADLALARARLAEARRRYEILKNGPDPDQLALAESKLDNAEAQLAATKASLQKLELRAPFAGTIASNELKVGEYVAPGVKVVLLVDYSDWLLETTDLTELNIVKISDGSPAVITCDALPDLQFAGLVKLVNSIGENRQGDITYTVLVDMNQLDERFLWNMTCSVVIFTEFDPSQPPDVNSGE